MGPGYLTLNGKTRDKGLGTSKVLPDPVPLPYPEPDRIARTCPLCCALPSLVPIPPAQGPVGGGPSRVCAVGMANLLVFPFPATSVRSGQLLILSPWPLTLLLATGPRGLRHRGWGSTRRVKPATEAPAHQSARLPGHGNGSGRGTGANAVGGSPRSFPSTVSPGGRAGGSGRCPGVPRRTRAEANTEEGRPERWPEAGVCPCVCA